MKNPNKPRSFGLDKGHIAKARKRIEELKEREAVQKPIEEVEEESSINNIIKELDHQTDQRVDSIANTLPDDYYHDGIELGGNIQKMIMNAKRFVENQGVTQNIINEVNEDLNRIDLSKEEDLSSSFKTGKDLNDYYLNKIKEKSYLHNRISTVSSQVEQKLVEFKLPYDQIQTAKKEVGDRIQKIAQMKEEVNYDEEVKEIISELKEKIIKDIRSKI